MLIQHRAPMLVSDKPTFPCKMDLLFRVVENNVLNKMDGMNIAIVFGPNLIFPPDNISMAASVATTNAIMNYTLANLDSLFPPSEASTTRSQSQSPLTFNSLFHETYRVAGDRDKDTDFSRNGFLTRVCYFSVKRQFKFGWVFLIGGATYFPS